MFDRRQLLALTGAGLAGIGLGQSAPAPVPADPAPEPGPPKIRARRPLGKTGLQLSDIGCGAINLFNPNVLRYALDCGVNHFDTAEAYMNTNSETLLGRALKGVRERAVITTKHLMEQPSDRNRAALVARVEASLKRLQTEYLDIALLHSADVPEDLGHEEVLAAYRQLKEQGKVRHVGFSTHQPVKMLEQALQSDFWEVVLLVYNHLEGKAAEPLMARARERGIGLIAMKVFAGGMQGSLQGMVGDRLTYPHAAIRWVLGNPSVDALIVTLSTFSHVDEYVAASGQPLERKDLAVLRRYREEAGPLYCRVSCRECLAACPRGVAVNDVLRYAMYFEHYRMERQAAELYSALELARTPAACAGCPGPCRSACPHGLAVPDRLADAGRLLASGTQRA